MIVNNLSEENCFQVQAEKAKHFISGLKNKKKSVKHELSAYIAIRDEDHVLTIAGAILKFCWKISLLNKARQDTEVSNSFHFLFYIYYI